MLRAAWPLGDAVLPVVERLKKLHKISQPVKEFEGRYVAPPHPAGSSAEKRSLLLELDYPVLEKYAHEKWVEYCQGKSWIRKGREQEDEGSYKAKRRSYWESIRLLRRAYEIDPYR